MKNEHLIKSSLPIIAVLFILLLPLTIKSQNREDNQVTKTGTIHGVVKLGNSSYIVNIGGLVVQVKGRNNKYSKKFKVTRSNGDFTAPDMSPGEYEISLEKNPRYELQRFSAE